MTRTIAEVISRAILAVIAALILLGFGLDMVERFAPIEVSTAIDHHIRKLVRLSRMA